jgi:hypothetical protein
MPLHDRELHKLQLDQTCSPQIPQIIQEAQEMEKLHLDGQNLL